MRLKIRAGSFKFFLTSITSYPVYLAEPVYIGQGQAFIRCERLVERSDQTCVTYPNTFFTIPLEIMNDEMEGETFRMDDVGAFYTILEACEADDEVTFMFTERNDGMFVEVYLGDDIADILPADQSTGGYPDLTGYGYSCPGLDISNFGEDEIVKAHLNHGLCVIFEMKKPGDVKEFVSFINSISSKKKLNYEGENFMGQKAKELAKKVEEESSSSSDLSGLAIEDDESEDLETVTAEEEVETPAEKPEAKEKKPSPEPEEAPAKEEKVEESPAPPKKPVRRSREEIEKAHIEEYSTYLRDRGFLVERAAETPTQLAGNLIEQTRTIMELLNVRMDMIEEVFNKCNDPAFMLDCLRDWLKEEGK